MIYEDNKGNKYTAFKFTLKKQDREPDWFLSQIGNNVIMEFKGFEASCSLKTPKGLVKLPKGNYVVKDENDNLYTYTPLEFEDKFKKASNQ